MKRGEIDEAKRATISSPQSLRGSLRLCSFFPSRLIRTSKLRWLSQSPSLLHWYLTLALPYESQISILEDFRSPSDWSSSLHSTKRLFKKCKNSWSEMSTPFWQICCARITLAPSREEQIQEYENNCSCTCATNSICDINLRVSFGPPINFQIVAHKRSSFGMQAALD